jgi:pimeloyl-ACP methyl ester carboxylesterase
MTLVNRLMVGVAALGAAVAGLGALNTALSWQAGPLESALTGSRRFYHWPRGADLYNVFYQVTGEGAPVVLIHGLDAAASSYEMRQVFAGLAAQHQVYALDLLGYGLSDRPNRTYLPRDYLDLIEDFLRDVVQQPAAVVASSLSAAYAVTVAARSPELVRALVLICPTGLQRLADPPADWQVRLGALLRRPVLGSALFNLLVSREALRYFLAERSYANPKLVTPAMLDAYYRTSHQDGARYAPAAFVGGALNLSIRETYPGLTQPVQIVWGREAQVTPVSDANLFIQARATSKLKVFEQCGLLLHDERPADFLALVEGFLRASTPAAAD